MNKNNNYKRKIKSKIFINNLNEISGFNSNYYRINTIKTPLTKKMITDRNFENNSDIRSKNPKGNLVYKSIFNSLGINPNKEIIINKTKNNIILKENEKAKYNGTNQKINKKQKHFINLKRQIQNVKNENCLDENSNLDYNINNNKINKDELLSNKFTGKILNKDINYQKQYSISQNFDNFLNNNIEDLNFENDINNGSLKIQKSNKKNLSYQKNEDSLNNNLLDKQEFISKIKEINDLEFIDGIRNKILEKSKLSNNEYLNDDIINLNYKKIDNKINTGRNKRNINFILSGRNEKFNTINSLKIPHYSFIYTPNNNNNLNNLFYNKNIHFNMVNKNLISSNINKENIYMHNLPNYEKNLKKRKIKKNNIFNSTNSDLGKINIYGLDTNINTIYSNKISSKKNNYLLSKKNNKQINFSTLSNCNIEKIENKNKTILNSNNKNKADYSIQSKNQNNKNSNKNLSKINSDNINNKLYKSNKYNTIGNNQYNNILNNTNNYLEIKEKYEKLKTNLKQKNDLIVGFSKIINEYKEKNNKLLKENKQLKENSKTKQKAFLEKIKEYQKEIYELKNSIELLKRNSTKNSKNENYNINIYNSIDYINQIKSLKEEIEKYKKENNNLKILVIKNRNNNIYFNSFNDINEKENENNLRNRFYSAKEKENKPNAKSYSVSKSKTRIKASSLSKKNFEEDDFDIPSDDNNQINNSKLKFSC